MLKKTHDATQTPNKLDMALGLRIRLRRKSQGLSQTALADAVGITFQQVQKYERGFNRVSFSRLVDIAHALECRVIDLIGDIDDAGLPSPLFREDTAHLREGGAPELLAAYSAMPSALRKTILKLVVAIAKDQRDHRREAENLEAEVRAQPDRRCDQARGTEAGRKAPPGAPRAAP